jgi:hypothetical protein
VSHITPQWAKMNPFEAAARINELERENAALRASITPQGKPDRTWSRAALCAFYEQAVDQRNTLERENAALRADKERLDWLQASAYWPFCYSEFEESSVKPLDGDGRDLRVALDAARKEEQP